MKLRKFSLLYLSLFGIGVTILFATVPSAHAQTPYIGYVYPAGGQQGQTVTVRVGGQGLDYVEGATVTGSGIKTRIANYYRNLNNQETAMLYEQLRELTNAQKEKEKANKNADPSKVAPKTKEDLRNEKLIEVIEHRVKNRVQIAQCRSISDLAFVEVTIEPNAEPGPRELRIVTAKGVSNAMVIYVGQTPEHTREPMITSTKQTLGKEALAMRTRPPEEAEVAITLPCTVNGQIASGEINSYRFTAKRGQRLVLDTKARELIPFIADAVPGWFQPVVVLYDSKGREVAYQDDYEFHPDPVLFYDVPEDGEYVAAIYDCIHRGREDFVYRLSISELPFVTSIFPLGGKAGALPEIAFLGRNVEGGTGRTRHHSATLGTSQFTVAKDGKVSTNRLPFAVGSLNEITEAEPNNAVSKAQALSGSLVINGKIDKPGDLDIYRLHGKAGETVVAEITARKLEAPTDAVLTLTDANGKILAYNDDEDDPAAGTNTHYADPYLKAVLPADGDYFIHVAETAHQGGTEYGYRLRVGAPQPDFKLLFTPSCISLKGKSAAAITVQVVRHDGFAEPIKIELKNPPAGFSAAPITIAGNANTGRFTIKSEVDSTSGAVDLEVQGTAKIGEQEISHSAIPCEDRMQAFLWKQWVPALDFKARVWNPNVIPPTKRKAPERPPLPEVDEKALAALPADQKPKFTRAQIMGRLNELRRLYEDDYLTDAFYTRKVEECESGTLK